MIFLKKKKKKKKKNNNNNNNKCYGISKILTLYIYY